MGEVAGDGSRLMTGLKYFRITGKDVEKEPYQPDAARRKATEHGRNFVFDRAAQLQHLARAMPIPPLVVAPYDAELYGHWWFEGPVFLEAVYRGLAETRGAVEATTLRHYLERHPVCAQATPSASTWGAGGYGEVWVGHEAAWTWRHVHHATRYAAWLVRKYHDVSGARGRALDQLIRELLLLQSSDWAFILRAGTATGYAEARIRAHVHRLRHLGYLLERAAVTEEDRAFIDDLRRRDNFLGEMEGAELRAPFLDRSQ
ncbi:MAG TPA: 1,4-alpha-glucan branching protein domain-containing protein, partial [Polyangiaceae bacterium]|nr:1,4-alpha-glucan branching protein domain-containing protein [Polyangiaceae bacterium]